MRDGEPEDVEDDLQAKILDFPDRWAARDADVVEAAAQEVRDLLSTPIDAEAAPPLPPVEEQIEPAEAIDTRSIEEILADEDDEDGDNDPALVKRDVKRPRFYCAGAKRTDAYTEKKICDYKAYHKWDGACPKCRKWYACLPFRKGRSEQRQKTLGAATMANAKPLVFHSTGIKELDKVLGGGVVYERTILVGSKKGAGKTTMLLQACNGFAQNGKKAYFASGEMSSDAVIEYARRLGIVNDNIVLYGNPEGIAIEELLENVLETGCKMVVIDSIQVCTVNDAKGDIGQVTMMDAVGNMVTSFAIKKKRAILMINQLQKEGDFAGSEKVQHLVDGLLCLEAVFAGTDAQGRPRDVGVRRLYIGGEPPKLRQADARQTAYVELTEKGIVSPSMKALREISMLEV